MADHNLAADRWLEYATRDEGERGDDPNYCIIQSRKHLLQIMFFASQLLTVAKGILFLLVVITLMLVGVLFGVFRP